MKILKNIRCRTYLCKNPFNFLSVEKRLLTILYSTFCTAVLSRIYFSSLIDDEDVMLVCVKSRNKDKICHISCFPLSHLANYFVKEGNCIA